MMDFIVTLLVVVVKFLGEFQAADGYFFGDSCGRSYANINPRIIGGQLGRAGEMPWMVRAQLMLHNGTTKYCGGFIVSDQWVVTAAHCVEGVGAVVVSAGRIDYSSRGSKATEQISVVSRESIFQHPQYDEARQDFQNDIALLHLPLPLQFNENIQPICMVDQNCPKTVDADSDTIDQCHDVWTSGWGMYEGYIISDKLRFVSLTMVSRDQCQQLYSLSQTTIHNSQICATGKTTGGDACAGDSGGPLFCLQGDKAVVIGIVSFGYTCGMQYPGVYLRICPYLAWISQVTSGKLRALPTIPTQPSTTTTPIPNCPSTLPTILNGKVSGSGFQVGTVREIVCNPLYTLNGDKNTTCTEKSQWTIPNTNCQFCKQSILL